MHLREVLQVSVLGREAAKAEQIVLVREEVHAHHCTAGPHGTGPGPSSAQSAAPIEQLVLQTRGRREKRRPFIGGDGAGARDQVHRENGQPRGGHVPVARAHVALESSAQLIERELQGSRVLHDRRAGVRSRQVLEEAHEHRLRGGRRGDGPLEFALVGQVESHRGLQVRAASDGQQRDEVVLAQRVHQVSCEHFHVAKLLFGEFAARVQQNDGDLRDREHRAVEHIATHNQQQQLLYLFIQLSISNS